MIILYFKFPISDIAWKDTLAIPFYATLISVVLVALRSVLNAWKRPREKTGYLPVRNDLSNLEENDDAGEPFVNPATYQRKKEIFFYFIVARFLGSFCLLGLQILGYVQHILDHHEKPFLLDKSLHWGMIVTFVYTTFLALIPLLTTKRNATVTRNNIFILLVTFLVYFYRDIWPLATTDGNPADIEEGWLLWAKFSVLSVTAVAIPLFIPREYVPVDPANPAPEPNPEQTASIFSMMFYIFLDPVISMAASVPHLSHSQLPPLADYDHSRYLTEKSFPDLDRFRGATDRYLFWNLLYTFRTDFVVLLVTILGTVVSGFLPAVGINRMLSYLESHDINETTIRPWFWVSFLLIGPTVNAICAQWYTFVLSRMKVRTEGLLTQLVFEHSLRIRMVADASASTESDSGSSNLSSKKGGNLIGKMNNLITSDISAIGEAGDFFKLIIVSPLTLILATVFLYLILGWSALAGITTIIVMFPVPGYLSKLLQNAEQTKMKITDSRIQSVTETLNVIRMIKLFGWEPEMRKRIERKREEELLWLWKIKVLTAMTGISNFLAPALTMIATFGSYTVILKQELTPSIVFTSMPIFTMMSHNISELVWLLGIFIRGKVSLDRLSEFLKDTELLDSYSDAELRNEEIEENIAESDILGFKDATFSWSNSSDLENNPNSSSDRTSFILRIEGELLFKRNRLNLIVGPTGCGKTSILMALLGEMHFIPDENKTSWFKLPRKGGVAYAAQESWVLNDTIRNNILFGSTYVEERYKKVIQQCALEHDLALFSAGDMTEVGERGLTLSGGQKARVTLARAVYSAAEILLLDDVLAALDVHTTKSVVEECFRGDLMQGRTIVLVTHNLGLVSPLADLIVSVGLDGKIASQTSDISVALQSNPELALELQEERELEPDEKQEGGAAEKHRDQPDGKLIVAEEIAEGHVRWQAILIYLKGVGGAHPFFFLSVFLGSAIFYHFAMTFRLWYLGNWGSQYETHAPQDVDDLKYLGTYSLLLVVIIVVYIANFLYYIAGTLKASKAIHDQLIASILSSTLRWLDQTPTSRIITRCTQDVRAVDNAIAMYIFIFLDIVISWVASLGAVILFTPMFIAPAACMVALSIYIGNIYLKAQLSIKREMSNAKAPLLAHIGAANAGIVSIRAYGAQSSFKSESLSRIDFYTRVARVSYNLNLWLAMRTELISSIFTTTLAAYLVYGKSTSAANSGFSLNMAVELCSAVFGGVQIFNQFEIQANSLERIKAYMDIDHEELPTKNGEPPAAWPTSGELRVENLSARYSSDGPTVLHDISFSLKPGERVGIVGRTGSGKSSLTLALLRCILTEGVVYFDGIATNKVNLDALRSRVTIIPQSPELLSGTLRRNLDPFGEHDDGMLNDALRHAGLFALQSDMNEGHITLDSSVASAGGNLSVGQRQIIALARAIVRRSKLLILDEATSAIDYKTDAIIQATLRNELDPDVTVITIAHRLQTVMDADKIMVLEDGRIIEFDSPKALLNKDVGKLKAFVDGSADRDILYNISRHELY